MAELSEFTNCCDDDGVPTEAEIRVAQAQLVGWLQGLLQGLQASMAAQQAAAAQQLRQLGPNRPQMPGPGGSGRRWERALPDQTRHLPLRPSLGDRRQATADGDDRAGHVGRRRRRQVDRDPGHVVGHADATERHIGGQTLADPRDR